MLGNGRLEAMCFDGVKRLCHIRGKLRKKVWINQSDIILVGLRDYQDARADVILKYSADEARNLSLTVSSLKLSRSTRPFRSVRKALTTTLSSTMSSPLMRKTLVLTELTIFRRRQTS